MNTPPRALPLSVPIPDAVKKKRVLLIDASQVKRDLRAEVLRKLDIGVGGTVRKTIKLSAKGAHLDCSISLRNKGTASVLNATFTLSVDPHEGPSLLTVSSDNPLRPSARALDSYSLEFLHEKEILPEKISTTKESFDFEIDVPPDVKRFTFFYDVVGSNLEPRVQNFVELTVERE